MQAIVNSKYVITGIKDFTLCMHNVFIGFKSEEEKVKALKQLQNIEFDDYSLTQIQFPPNSGLTTISIFESYES